MSVRRRLPAVAMAAGVKATDLGSSVPLAQIGMAINAAEANMFVTFVRNPNVKASDAWRYGPTLTARMAMDDTGHFPSYPNGVVTSGGLGTYDATTVFGYAPTSTSYLLSLDAKATALPSRTPSLVWQVLDIEDASATVGFVTLDGDTYRLPLKPDGHTFELKVSPPTLWPPSNATMVVGRRGVDGHALRAVDDAFEKCAERVTRLTKKEPDGGIVRRHCAKQIVAWEKALAKELDARAEARSTLYSRAKSRIQTMLSRRDAAPTPSRP